MDYITEIFDRLSLQQIREFLLHGVECLPVSDGHTNNGWKRRENPFSRELMKCFPNKKKTLTYQMMFIIMQASPRMCIWK